MRSTKYDCCNCSHYRVCYKIRMYNVGQENTGLYCPSFDKKKSEVAKEIILEIDTLICCHANGDIDDKRLYLLFDEIKKEIHGRRE